MDAVTGHAPKDEQEAAGMLKLTLDTYMRLRTSESELINTLLSQQD